MAHWQLAGLAFLAIFYQSSAVPVETLGLESPEPWPEMQLSLADQPIEEAFPAFARGDPPSFKFRVPIKGKPADVWQVLKNQPGVLTALPPCNEIFNTTGGPGDWLMVISWWTPKWWHRWTRYEVRRYRGFNETDMSLSYNHVLGLGLWQPRLAFRERVLKDFTIPKTKNGKPGQPESTLEVEVWYELDESKINWPTDNIKKLTKRRWEFWYKAPNVGYAKTIQRLVSKKIIPGDGQHGPLNNPKKLLKFKEMKKNEM